MKIYVDELPKNCLECICRNGEYNHCKLIALEHSIGYYNEEEMDYKDVPINQDFEELECPLQSIANYTKRVRKDVIEKIRYSLLDFSHSYWKVFKQNGKQYMTDDDLSECLDEILGKIGEKEC